MQTSLKIGFAQISLPAQKIQVAQILGGLQPPPLTHTPMCPAKRSQHALRSLNGPIPPLVLLPANWLNKWTQIHTISRNARRPVITMVTNLPHEIVAKCQPVHRNLEIKWHGRRCSWKKEKPAKNGENRKRSPKVCRAK